ncbi:type I-B CRISPR-associated protein Cas5b [Clostridium sp. BSD9I1]|uniref:type I-B CRISPR-associated protein Cas5b n=1 Tax=Clostridium sp. BSD9I1 TaxID=2003589 RepID=UPI001647B58F|nr:type I-B CRISPR-associated protein Cas5b [Clostridium sp. BSD9I1]
MKALIFRAWGDFARFRCPYTTTSALTYTLIHPIAVKGLIGAIMGIDYSDLYNYTQNMKIAVEVLKPIKKDTQSFNLVPQSHGNGAPSFQSRVEFLRDVDYRIYLTYKDEMQIEGEEELIKIKDVLVNRSYTFTPYLGASEHIAKLQFEDIKHIENIASKETILINSVFPKELIKIEDNVDMNICIDRIPVKNEKTREYMEYTKVAFVTNGSIAGKSEGIVKVGESNVYFF